MRAGAIGRGHPNQLGRFSQTGNLDAELVVVEFETDIEHQAAALTDGELHLDALRVRVFVVETAEVIGELGGQIAEPSGAGLPVVGEGIASPEQRVMQG